MPALKLTEYTCRIAWLGRVADRDAALASAPVETLAAGFDGPEGEAHGGINRPSCSRVMHLHPRDTEIRNVRQFSVLSMEDLAAIAKNMEIDALPPEWVGATMAVEGLPDFTHLPPSSRLQGPDGVTLVVDMENRPCQLPARVIEDHLPGKGKLFKSAADGRRGVTAWVEREGVLKLGDTLRLAIPDQPVWAELARA
ncbi:MOSC domain-containing protein [Pseudooceanicola sp. C21-150M6]|uniref:MOSC domain-containing protein n=1 Tax=Pseudooceanicola sp. C21-150M6 TaxID=3434355 RepID=UPI003D7F9933